MDRLEVMKPLQIQCYITGLKSMTNSWRIQIDTIENVNPEHIAYIADKQNKPGWFTFNVRQIENEEIINLPSVKNKEKKSKSLRLREVLYRLWEHEWTESYGDFQDFYDFYMEQIIDRIKSKL